MMQTTPNVAISLSHSVPPMTSAARSQFITPILPLHACHLGETQELCEIVAPVPHLARLSESLNATVWAGQMSMPSGKSAMHSAVLQLLIVLRETDAKNQLLVDVQPIRLTGVPACERSARQAECPMIVGKGSDRMEFLVRPFHSAALRGTMPHLSFVREAFRTNCGCAGHTFRQSADFPAHLLTLPPECLLFGDQLPVSHRDAFPTYTNRSSLWATAMLLLHFTRDEPGVSPLVVRTPGPVGGHTGYAWRYPAPVDVVNAIKVALDDTNSRLHKLLASRYDAEDVAHYLWGLVEMLGWPNVATDLQRDARFILAHSSLWAILEAHRDKLRFAFMRAPDAPTRTFGWLQGIYQGEEDQPLLETSTRELPIVVDVGLPDMRATMRRLRPTFRAMLHWDQWRGRHRADIVLRRVLGALVEGPLVCHVTHNHVRKAPPKRAKNSQKRRRVTKSSVDYSVLRGPCNQYQAIPV